MHDSGAERPTTGAYAKTGRKKRFDCRGLINSLVLFVVIGGLIACVMATPLGCKKGG